MSRPFLSSIISVNIVSHMNLYALISLMCNCAYVKEYKIGCIHNDISTKNTDIK